MKIFKIVAFVLVVGLGAFFFNNADMMKPVFKQVQLAFGVKEDNVQTVSALKVVPVNRFLIDPTINKEEFAVDSRIKNIYREISKRLIQRDKEIRKRLLFIQDKCPEDIGAFMAELEPMYEIERKKVIQYCQDGSENCLVEVSLTGDSVEGSDVEMNIRYTLDPESAAFFNKVEYVNKEMDKWYEAKLLGINEKRYYPKIGKFQDREQNSMTQSDLSKRVDISHILEGNSDQWNVRFDANTSTNVNVRVDTNTSTNVNVRLDANASTNITS